MESEITEHRELIWNVQSEVIEITDNFTPKLPAYSTERRN
jgi:hypothetical protein